MSSIQAHPDFTDSVVIMSPLASGVDDIISESGITILSAIILPVQDYSFSPISSIYSKDLMNSYKSNILFQTNDLSLSLVSSDSK